MDIYGYLKQRGYQTVSADFHSLIDRWRSWYQGGAEAFRRYKVYNGVKQIKCTRRSLGMAKKLCEDWANLLLNERVAITIQDGAVQEFIRRVFADTNFWVRVSEAQEIKAAVGTVAYLPYADGVSVAQGEIVEGGALRISVVSAEQIFPLSWQDGEITECAFAIPHTVNGENYLVLQIHRLEPDGYVLENVLFSTENGQLREIADVSGRKGLETLAREWRTHSRERPFVIDRLNLVNNLDAGNPMGIAVYANALDLLEGLDLIYDSYINEFALGKKRIMVREEATAYLNENPIFDENDLVFYQIPKDVGDESYIKEIDMKLRTTEHQTGLRDTLNTLAAKCGFGENHYKFDQGGIATATQVISENSTLFRVLKKHEIVLESALKELIRLLVRLGRDVLKQPLSVPEFEDISIDFDDSIIEDKQTACNDMRQDVAAGLLRPEVYLAKRYGVSEEEAKKLLPQTVDLEG